MRGIAVLVMIEAHAVDAWTTTAARKGLAFRNLTILGGFAAPLFLFLAGVGVVLSADRMLERTNDSRTAGTHAIKRGLEIFLLAFLFRLQAFIVSPGGPLIALFRVDILNIMGPAMAVAALAWMLATAAQETRTRNYGPGNKNQGPGVRDQTLLIALFAVMATTVALLTPLARESHAISALPTWIQWYIRPWGDQTTFTIFPWAGFVFGGSAVGVVIARRRSMFSTAAAVELTAAGLAVVALGFFMSARPSILGASSFWTSSPSYFVIRMGVVATALGLACVLDRVIAESGPLLHALERFGRSSLFVYWIHVELVYGYATWPLRKRLLVPQMAAAWALFVIAMYFAVVLRDDIVGRWKASRAAGEMAQVEPIRGQVT
jgi:uncharacterized membrane protein